MSTANLTSSLSIIVIYFLVPFRLKHDNLILQQWKTEVGMVAVETANTLNSQIEIVEQSSQQYQLELEGIQLENQSMSQQIKAYRDEVCHTTNCCEMRNDPIFILSAVFHFEFVYFTMFHSNISLQHFTPNPID